MYSRYNNTTPGNWKKDVPKSYHIWHLAPPLLNYAHNKMSRWNSFKVIYSKLYVQRCLVDTYSRNRLSSITSTSMMSLYSYTRQYYTRSVGHTTVPSDYLHYPPNCNSRQYYTCLISVTNFRLVLIIWVWLSQVVQAQLLSRLHPLTQY